MSLDYMPQMTRDLQDMKQNQTRSGCEMSPGEMNVTLQVSTSEGLSKFGGARGIQGSYQASFISASIIIYLFIYLPAFIYIFVYLAVCLLSIVYSLFIVPEFVYIMALWPTQPPTQWIPGALSLGVKRPGGEANHSPPSSAEVKNAWSYTSTPQYVFMAWCLVKHRDNFTFYILHFTFM
jgi:hypothetical protein